MKVLVIEIPDVQLDRLPHYSAIREVRLTFGADQGPYTMVVPVERVKVSEYQTLIEIVGRSG